MAIVAGSVDVEVVGTDNREISEGGVSFPHVLLWYCFLRGEIIRSRCEGPSKVREAADCRGVGSCRICGEVMGGGSQKALSGSLERKQCLRFDHLSAARRAY